eukprot:3458590-Prymnesium_polylepis.1
MAIIRAIWRSGVVKAPKILGSCSIQSAARHWRDSSDCSASVWIGPQRCSGRAAPCSHAAVAAFVALPAQHPAGRARDRRAARVCFERWQARGLPRVSHAGGSDTPSSTHQMKDR